MTAPVDTATVGKRGAVCTKSLATSGTQRNIPVMSFVPNTSMGVGIPELINNAAFEANSTLGFAVANIGWEMPFIPGITPADFFTRAVGSILGDSDAGNYHNFTVYPDDDGSASENYGACKYSGISGQITFSTDGNQQSARFGIAAVSADPESTSITPLTAPSSNTALSTGQLLGYANTAFTGASSIVSVQFQVGTGLKISPGKSATANANYANLVKGLLQTAQRGTVMITQLATAGTVIGAGGGTLVVSVGTTGAGCSFTFKLIPSQRRRPVTTDIGYITRTYLLKSLDGTTAPFVVADL